jgi:ABC-type nitrate/sulfonate/bicarbonate transport system ATPase subunit
MHNIQYNFGPFNLDILPALKIQNLNIDIDNSIVHFWGENGVGKSTVINLIIKECIKRGINFSSINQNYRQNWLWWYDVEKNLRLAANLKNNQKLQDLDEVKDQWVWLEKILTPNHKQVNFSTQEEINAINLSGGQLQRLIIFREILRKPKFLFLDEVFSALDKQVVGELISWLLDVQKKYNFNIISISHDKEILRLLAGTVFYFEKDANGNLKIEK